MRIGTVSNTKTRIPSRKNKQDIMDEIVAELTGDPVYLPISITGYTQGEQSEWAAIKRPS